MKGFTLGLALKQRQNAKCNLEIAYYICTHLRRLPSLSAHHKLCLHFFNLPISCHQRSGMFCEVLGSLPCHHSFHMIYIWTAFSFILLNTFLLEKTTLLECILLQADEWWGPF